MMNKNILFVGIIVVMFVIASGCISSNNSDPIPDGETNWHGLLDSYDQHTNRFVNFSGSVVVEDIVIEARNIDGGTKFTLQSNEMVKVHLTETYEHDGPFMANDYANGDEIFFSVTISSDDYGEYIKEVC